MQKRNRIVRYIVGMLIMLSVLAMLGACGKKEKDASDDVKKKVEEGTEKSEKKEKKDKKDKKDKKSEGKKKKDKEKDEEKKSGQEEKFKADKEKEKPAYGASFAGDWEGMTIVYDSKGTHKGKGVSDDWIYGTYMRVYFDEDEEMHLDMIGVMPEEARPLNFEINYSYYDPEFDEIEIGGLLSGGEFDALIPAPGDDGLIAFTGKTTGDVKSSYAVYLKRLDSEWDRADAPMIGDKEYNIYITNNLPNMKGMTIEERVGLYNELGVYVDMNDFLKPQ